MDMLQVAKLKDIENALSMESDEAKMPIGESCALAEPCTELTSPSEEKSSPATSEDLEEVLITQPKLLEAEEEEKSIVSPPVGDIVSTAFRIGDSEADANEE
eukprot:453132_1